MREPRFSLFALLAVLRITPAHAGTTYMRICLMADYEDHPRSCGNHENKFKLVTNIVGSPPLMREPPRRVTSTCSKDGITPAHAGTTLIVTNCLISLQDHPRSCGNHRLLCKWSLPSTGSPPLMREPQIIIGFFTFSIGITPAHAGTTKERVKRTNNQRDHPRSCGNHLSPAPSGATSSGSPPLMREPPINS